MVMSNGELGDVGLWSDKARNAKGGTVHHHTKNDSAMKKMCCDKMMGEKCDCPGPFTGKKDRK